MNDTTHEHLWLDHGDARLHAVATGHGTPIVFLHGALADHRAALLRLAALAPRHRVIAPDVRAAGRSHFHGALTWDLLADDIVAWLDRLGLADAIVGGISAGCGAAVRFALRHPSRARALVFASPTYTGPARALTDAEADACARMAATGERVAREGIDALLPLYDHLPAPIREVALAMARSFDPMSVATTTRFVASDAEPLDDLADLRAITAPVLIIPGSDREHPAEIAAQYAAHLPDAVVGHADGIDLAPAIAAFCRSVDRRSSH